MDIDQQLASLLQLLDGESAVSAARACKRLQLPRSQLNRLLSVLGEDGLGLVQIDPAGDADRLSLSDAGRRWLEQLK